MDKSRPSREHSLVEWARPLLNHNKKLLRILDPRMEGQYLVKTAMKVAHLAYQCLSQNPKGRPLMCQVVEILETFQSRGQNEEETMLQSGGSCITLYEAPKDTLGTSADERNLNTNDDERAENRNLYKVDREHTERGGGRSRAGNVRSKSEPQNDLDLYGTFPDLALDEKSASTRS